jgi:Sortase domain
MGHRLRRLLGRVVPAVIAAAGVALVFAGLLAWTDPKAIGSTGSPSPSPEATASPVAIATPAPTLAPIPSIGPAGSATAMPAPSTVPTPSPRTAVATRVVVPALDIDLPVVKAPDNESFPYCDVAEYSAWSSQPGQGGAVFLYAHARDGMFLPLLEASKVAGGKSMLGMVVQVYTSDDMVFLYEITDVYRHQDSLDKVLGSKGENLFLQTSEGPPRNYTGYTGLVLILQAAPLGSQAADPNDAHPKPRPRVCS